MIIETLISIIANHWYTGIPLVNCEESLPKQVFRDCDQPCSFGRHNSLTKKGMRMETIGKTNGNRTNNNETKCLQSAYGMQTT